MTRAYGAWALAVVATALVVAAAYASFYKGGWFDEYYSVHAAVHRLPLGQMFSIWLTDTHPPLAHFLNWLFEPVVGDDIQARRALNLIPLVAAATAIFVLAKDRRSTSAFAIVFALLMLASPTTIEQLIEHRANFAQLAAMSVVVMTLARVEFADRDLGWADRSAAIILAVATGFAFNLHYVGALSAGVVLTLSIVRQWLAQRRRWAVAQFGICAVAALPLVAAFAAQQTMLGNAAAQLWVMSSTADATKTIADLTMTGAKANVVVTVAALLGVVAMLHRRPTSVPPGLRLAGLLMLGAFTVFAVLLALNTMRPIIMTRYLVSEVPLLAGAMAALAVPVIGRSGWWLVAATVAALMTLVIFAWRRSGTPHWTANARAIGQIVKSCPSTAVHTPRQWEEAVVGGGAENLAAFDTGFAALSRRYGLRLEPQDSHRVDRTCPTVIWAEHYHMPPPSPLLGSEGLPICANSIARATTTRSASGFFVSYPACR